MSEVAPFVDDWTGFANRLLTEDVVQVSPSERVVVATPGYFSNLTLLLKEEEPRDVANYLMWRAAKSSLGYLSKSARETAEEYSRKRTGRKATTPRWKECVSAAAGAFSAAIGKM